MARNTYEDWIPEEWTGPVITKVNQTSAIESLATRIPMGTDTKHVPRSGGVDVTYVAKGSAYPEDESANDQVLLEAKKFGRIIRIADEDIDDINYVSIVEGKRVEWGSSYAKFIDNATLGVTAAANGSSVPFTSVYRAVQQYNGGAQLTQTAGAATYADLSLASKVVEGSDYFDEGGTVVIAHPAFKGVIRDLVDLQGRPIFQDGAGATPGTLFGLPIRWSLGAKTSATATSSPGGNPLLITGPRNMLLLGIRSGPESKFADADSGPAFGTDEALVKMRARRAFAVGQASAFSVIEITA